LQREGEKKVGNVGLQAFGRKKDPPKGKWGERKAGTSEKSAERNPFNGK